MFFYVIVGEYGLKVTRDVVFVEQWTMQMTIYLKWNKGATVKNVTEWNNMYIYSQWGKDRLWRQIIFKYCYTVHTKYICFSKEWLNF